MTFGGISANISRETMPSLSIARRLSVKTFWDMPFIPIQVKENSLEGYTMSDAAV